MNAPCGVNECLGVRKAAEIMQPDSEGGAILVTEMMVKTFIEALH